jgi:DNA-binding response OmpR family regulator
MVPVLNGEQDRQILVIEDDPMLGKVLVHSLENLGVSVISIDEPDEAIELIMRISPSLVIIDMEDTNPKIDILEEIRNLTQSDLLLLRSERLDKTMRTRLQPKEVIYKPFDTRFVCRRVLDLLS